MMSQARPHVEQVPMASGDVLPDQIAKLKQLFPEVVSEGTIDFDKLRATLGQAASSGPGRFHFSGAGKDEAQAVLQTPSRATLVPAVEQSVKFDSSKNIFIEGDNLEVLKLLYKPYFGRVKLIYIDPPYNTGNDFVYPDDYADPLRTYLRLTGQSDDEGNVLTSNPESSGRYHSAWLSMMYPRLFLARQLLREDGVIFISIDDHEVHHLRLLMNEIFGEENFVECFVWKRSYGGGAKEKYAVSQHEYIMMYCRSLDGLPEFWMPSNPEAEKKYYKYKDDKYEKRGPYRLQPLEAGKSMDPRPNLVYDIVTPDGRSIKPKRQWLWKQDRVKEAIQLDNLVFSEKNNDTTVAYKQYLLSEEGVERGAKPASVVDGIYTQHGTQEIIKLFSEEHVFQFPKPTSLIRFINQFCTRDDDLVLDFFAGSCTTAQAVMELNRADGGNRQFIMVQLPEPTKNPQFPTIAEIGKERIRRVIAKLNAETGNLTRTEPEDLGFKVFRLTKPNIRPWHSDASDDIEMYKEKLNLFIDVLAEGWTAANVLWEIALREGYSLNTTFATKTIECGTGSVVLHEVTVPDKEPPQMLSVCLEETIPSDLAKHYPLSQDHILVCRDKALDDTGAANLALQCRLKTI